MKTIYVCKAQCIDRGLDVEITRIFAEQEIPDFKTLEEQDKFMQLEAESIEAALYNSLPGGTYDRLLGVMLQHKATHFRVAHKEWDKS